MTGPARTSVVPRAPTMADRRTPRAFGAAAAGTALVVGTVLTLINHPDLLSVQPTAELLVKIGLNYLVPFLVAGYSRLGLLRHTDRAGAAP